VILLGRTIRKLEQVYDEIEQAGGPKPAIYPMNLEGRRPRITRSGDDAGYAEFGRLDGLLHNAALFAGLTPLANYDIELVVSDRASQFERAVFADSGGAGPAEPLRRCLGRVHHRPGWARQAGRIGALTRSPRAAPDLDEAAGPASWRPIPPFGSIASIPGRSAAN
jgi:hypothetical protein